MGAAAERRRTLGLASLSDGRRDRPPFCGPSLPRPLPRAPPFVMSPSARRGLTPGLRMPACIPAFRPAAAFCSPGRATMLSSCCTFRISIVFGGRRVWAVCCGPWPASDPPAAGAAAAPQGWGGGTRRPLPSGAAVGYYYNRLIVLSLAESVENTLTEIEPLNGPRS